MAGPAQLVLVGGSLPLACGSLPGARTDCIAHLTWRAACCRPQAPYGESTRRDLGLQDAPDVVK